MFFDRLSIHGNVNPHQINHNNNIGPHGNSILIKKQLKGGNIAAIEPYHITQPSNDQNVDKLQKNYFIPVITNQVSIQPFFQALLPIRQKHPDLD